MITQHITSSILAGRLRNIALELWSYTIKLGMIIVMIIIAVVTVADVVVAAVGIDRWTKMAL